MSDVVIRADGLGKKYLVGHESDRERYVALRDVIAREARNLVRSAGDMIRGRQLVTGDEVEEFWALKDVDFEIKRGEVVGIIGRNGAGKSTLLKILSRITEPSTGRVEIRGRVASLLEVGTGFHPELTGRENIYLNGAILGMTRAEIKLKFDEIVDFAGVEKFLDTPVKRYSSGMYVRLAFAVAAHLEPEILIIDEVLAVGDAEFQKKCLGKMRDVAGHGRTILFVSHNISAVRQLCSRAVLLSGGRIAIDAPTAVAVERYTAGAEVACSVQYAASTGRPSITGITVDETELAARRLLVSIGYCSPYPFGPAIGGLVLSTANGEPVWGSNGHVHPFRHAGEPAAQGTIQCTADALPLRSGRYRLSVWLGDSREDFDSKLDALSFDLGNDDASHPRLPTSIAGPLDWSAEWRVVPNATSNRKEA